MSWIVAEQDLPADMNLSARSSIFSVGNGQRSTRGSLSEDTLGTYRGCYQSGLFTRAGWGLLYYMQGPDWLQARVEVEGQRQEPIRSHRALDLKTGCLVRNASYQIGDTEVDFVEERFMSWDQSQVIAQQFHLMTKGSDTFDLVLAIDGNTRNHVAKYFTEGDMPTVTGDYIRTTEVVSAGGDDATLDLVMRSAPTDKHIACRMKVTQPDSDLVLARADRKEEAAIRYTIDAAELGTGSLCFEKTGVICADVDGFEQAIETRDEIWPVISGQDYGTLKQNHVAAVLEFWDGADVEIEGDARANLAVRFALWCTRIASPLDGGSTSTAAKNLTGDWYRGTVFWDMDMFHVPVLAAVSPQHAVNHVRYRYNRLDSARILASQDGYKGSRFPWNSFGTGLEEPIVLGGYLYQLQHVNVAVAMSVLQSYALSGDDFMMLENGLELLWSVCTFWASRVEGPKEDGLYHMSMVTGPDEDHQGVNDNAYTSRMVIYLFEQARAMKEAFLASHPEPTQALLDRLEISDDTIEAWQDIASKIYLPKRNESNLFDAFEGFGDLPEPDENCRDFLGDRGDKPMKQADTLLMFQVLPNEFSQDMLETHWREYAPLCTHGSSLSLGTHAVLAARLGLERDAVRLFHACCGMDLEDEHGNTNLGIHGAGEANIWLAAVHGFGGLQPSPEKLVIKPNLNPEWEALHYRFFFQGQALKVSVSKDAVEVTNRGEFAVTLTIIDKEMTIDGGSTARVDAKPRWRPQQLEAVIFDLDGVLVTTDNYHYKAWKNLADGLGIPFDEEKNHQLRGVSREESLRRIYGDLPLPDNETFAAQCTQKNDEYKKLIQQMTPDDVLPGALELLKELRSRGIKTGIASASKNAPMVLERTGLDKWVDVIADGNIVTKSKPSPQVFFLASQRLRVLPWNCVGVEDAAAGVESIHSAGMVALGIGDTAEGAEKIIASTADSSVEMIEALFNEHQNLTDPYLERNLERAKEDASASYAATLSSGKK